MMTMMLMLMLMLLMLMQIYRRPLGMEEVMALGKPLGRHCKELILHHLEIESHLVEEAERVMHVYYPCLGPDFRLQCRELPS
jgi:hypothetical protein